MSILPSVREKVEVTPFIDTHEHLIEEKQRLAGPPPNEWLFPCDDWAYLFMHYTRNDLNAAGMSLKEQERFYSMAVDPEDKWPVFAPYWPRIQHTGYGQAVTYSIRRLYGEESIGPHNVARLTEKMRKRVRKGYYREILQDVCGIESCQVNSLEPPTDKRWRGSQVFCVSEYPTLLHQDLSTVAMSTELNVPQLAAESGLPARSLDDWYRVIDWYFERYGPRAVATKNQSAYARRLDYENVPKEVAAPLFARYAEGKDSLGEGGMKALQDHLWRYGVRRATEMKLPVKLHTGYYAGTNYMPLARVGQNLNDLCPILLDFPETRFVLMHITYPYQDQLIALAKHYTNVYVDMCWAWIINPAASVRFLKEYLMAAPSSKIFTFGGDYITVETVYGHSQIARRGIAQALSELVEEGWLAEKEALALVEPLMCGNAREVFRIEEKQQILEAVH